LPGDIGSCSREKKFVCTQKRELKSPLEIERVSFVRAIPRARVALKRRRCQAAEVLE
jgi:hypothetical protein